MDCGADKIGTRVVQVIFGLGGTSPTGVLRSCSLSISRLKALSGINLNTVFYFDYIIWV
jgi:hypothetical protein